MTDRIKGTLTITPASETIAQLSKIRTRLERSTGVIPASIPDPVDFGVGTEDWDKIYALDVAPYLIPKEETEDTYRVIFSGKPVTAKRATPEIDLPAQVRKIVKIVRTSGATLTGTVTQVDSSTGTALRVLVVNNRVSTVKGEIVISFADGSAAALNF